MKLASVSRLSGVRTNSGRPSVEPGDRLAGQVVVGQQAAAVGVAAQRLAQQHAEHVVGARPWPRAPRRTGRTPRPTRPSSLAPLLQCTIATRSPDGVVTRSSSWCTLRQRLLEHDHREDAGADADVARARCDGVRRDHPGAGVALGRAQRDARLQRAGGVEQRRAGLGQRCRRPGRRRRTSGSRRRRGVGPGYGREHPRVVGRGSPVSIGNMPDASPMPSTLRPVSFQCT